MAKTKDELLAEISLKFDARIAALQPKFDQYNQLVARRDELIRAVNTRFDAIAEAERLAAMVPGEPVIKD